jgi:hypothetical protein
MSRQKPDPLLLYGDSPGRFALKSCAILSGFQAFFPFVYGVLSFVNHSYEASLPN